MPQASVEFPDRDHGIGGEGHGIELGVINPHLADIGLGSLGSRILEVGS